MPLGVIAPANGLNPFFITVQLDVNATTIYLGVFVTKVPLAVNAPANAL